ncbi:MAG: class I SAM-dependent methyltransferase [Candidatus Omnitrophica bacterium]|nr:class I SAM-dependent methyltransferase [Candidatus Omnitrophota bacterium]
MNPIVNPEIESYAAKHTSPEPALFKNLARTTWAATDLPQMQVGHLEGSFLRLLMRIARAKRVLEIGTFTGYSALAMAEGLPTGGRLITCDINPDTTKIAKAYWAKSPHGKKIQLRLGHAAQTIQRLKGPFDAVFIDADKENYIRYWELCVPKIRKGGILLADNTLWGGRVLRPQDSSDRAIAAFNRRVAADKRVEAVMLTLRDGLTLAVKK